MNFILLVYIAGALVWQSPPLDSMNQCRALLSEMAQGFDSVTPSRNGVAAFDLEVICKPVAEWVSA